MQNTEFTLFTPFPTLVSVTGGSQPHYPYINCLFVTAKIRI